MGSDDKLVEDITPAAMGMMGFIRVVDQCHSCYHCFKLSGQAVGQTHVFWHINKLGMPPNS